MRNNIFKNGMRVRISDNINRTKDEHSLDEDGDMLNMRTKVFIIDSTTEYNSYINNPQGGGRYVFCNSDLSPVDEEEIKPKIFEFDTKHL